MIPPNPLSLALSPPCLSPSPSRLSLFHPSAICLPHSSLSVPVSPSPSLLLLSPLPSPLSLFQGSNEYLSRPCSVTWENTHSHTHSHSFWPLSPLVWSSASAFLFGIFRVVMVKERANLSTHLLLWIKEEGEEKTRNTKSKAEQCQTGQIKTERSFTELN